MNKEPHIANIELHINELVLHGFPRSERHRIGEAVRQELLRQFSEQGIPDSLSVQGNIKRLNAGTIQMGQGSKPERTGKQVAQAVYGSVSGGQSSGYAARHSDAVHKNNTRTNSNIMKT